MTTEVARAMKAVVSQVHPVLQAAGFRKRAHTFNRSGEPGLVQVIELRLGRISPPFTTLTVSGLGANPYARFAVSLGVFIDEAWRLEDHRFDAHGPSAVKDWVAEPDCQLRRRLRHTRPASRRWLRRGDRESASEGWPLDEADIATRVVEAVRGEGFGWFDRFTDRPAILSALESSPAGSNEISGVGGADLMLAVRMRVAAGDTQRAQELFDRYVGYCRSRVVAEPHVRHHLQTLADFARRTDLAMPAES